jgi:phage-related tail protein
MFMSNSGHLSEIKVPAFGNWSPPSSGQVIPAHISSQIRDARENAKVEQAMATGGGLSRVTSSTLQQVTHESSGLQRALVSELRRMGDNPGSVSNQITIQSTKPVNDASRMLAEMGRLKAHRRY